jgi:hypothetical protein
MSAQKFKTKAGLQVATSALLECTTTAQTVLPQANTTYNIGSTAMTYSNMYATTFNGRATAANWSDLAEKYQADKKYEQGTVLAIGGTKEVTLFKKDMPLAGIVSTKPGLQLNASDETKSWPFICLKGRVPCKITGPCKKGNYIVAHDNGKGKARATITDAHQLIGIALADSDGETVEVKV